MSFRLILNALLLLFKCSWHTALLSYQKEFFIYLIALASFVPRVYRLVFGYTRNPPAFAGGLSLSKKVTYGWSFSRKTGENIV